MEFQTESWFVEQDMKFYSPKVTLTENIFYWMLGDINMGIYHLLGGFIKIDVKNGQFL